MQTLEWAWTGLSWNEDDAAILRRFDGRAIRLSRPIDFGDSYARIVMRDVELGGTRLIAYYQMDKATRRLKRVQLERPHRGVNPPAYRAVIAALTADYGAPEVDCREPPAAANGYQATMERSWRRGAIAIRAIFRDTTLEAFEGCYVPPCGLTGRMLVRISPAAAEAERCTAPAARVRRD